MTLSNCGVLSNKSNTAVVGSAAGGTTVGKSVDRTPPSVWPHATSWIISDTLNPCLAKLLVRDSIGSLAFGTPKEPATFASIPPPRKGITGPPHVATDQTVAMAMTSAPEVHQHW